MEKCLVTKLNGVVDGNLPKLGQVSINVASGKSIEIKRSLFNADADVWLVSGNVSCTIGGSSVSLPHKLVSSEQLTITASADSVVAFTSVYDFKVFDLGTSNDWNVDTESFKYSPITWAAVGGCKLFHGDIKYLFKKGNVQTSVTIENDVLGDNLYGDIKYLGNCTSATLIEVRYQSGLFGSIESLVAKFRENEKTTGSITVKTNTAFTFNGNNTTERSHTLEWTATTITWDSTTINA